MVLTRRQLLIGTAGISALGIAGAYVGLHTSKPTLLEFDFLNRGNDGSLQEWASDLSDLVKKSIPVTSFSSALISDEVKVWAVGYANTKGISETEKEYGQKVIRFRVNDQIQHRHKVVPEPDITYAAQYQAYAEFATHFLFEHPELQSFPQFPIEWLFPQDRKPERAIPAYIVHSYIQEQKIRLEFILKDRSKVNAEIMYPKLGSGGRLLGGSWNFDSETGELEKSTWHPQIIVSTYNKYALQAPFSEITPLMFAEGIGKDTRQLAEKNPLPNSFERKKEILRDSERLGETITESVSIYMLTQLIQHPSMTQARPRTSITKIEQAGAELALVSDGRYSDVPKAYEYLKKNGLRATVHLFTDDPVLYLERVKAT